MAYRDPIPEDLRQRVESNGHAASTSPPGADVLDTHPGEADSEGPVRSHRMGGGFDGNKSALPIKTVEEVLAEAGESVDWIVEGLLARGSLTDFSGLAKRGGKTTFWCHAIVAGAKGEEHGGSATVAASPT